MFVTEIAVAIAAGSFAGWLAGRSTAKKNLENFGNAVAKKATADTLVSATNEARAEFRALWARDVLPETVKMEKISADAAKAVEALQSVRAAQADRFEALGKQLAEVRALTSTSLAAAGSLTADAATIKEVQAKLSAAVAGWEASAKTAVATAERAAVLNREERSEMTRGLKDLERGLGQIKDSADLASVTVEEAQGVKTLLEEKAELLDKVTGKAEAAAEKAEDAAKELQALMAQGNGVKTGAGKKKSQLHAQPQPV